MHDEGADDGDDYDDDGDEHDNDNGYILPPLAGRNFYCVAVV